MNGKFNFFDGVVDTGLIKFLRFSSQYNASLSTERWLYLSLFLINPKGINFQFLGKPEEVNKGDKRVLESPVTDQKLN